jgi:hypothetical protein
MSMAPRHRMKVAELRRRSKSDSLSTPLRYLPILYCSPVLKGLKADRTVSAMEQLWNSFEHRSPAPHTSI